MEYGDRTPDYSKTTPRLSKIIQKVNKKTNGKFNTILIQKYESGKHYIAPHKDLETDWRKGSGVASLAFGANRPMKFKSDSGEVIIKMH
jgi:alkylated DNA repair dioxygenase AlkB